MALSTKLLYPALMALLVGCGGSSIPSPQATYLADLTVNGSALSLPTGSWTFGNDLDGSLIQTWTLSNDAGDRLVISLPDPWDQSTVFRPDELRPERAPALAYYDPSGKKYVFSTLLVQVRDQNLTLTGTDDGRVITLQFSGTLRNEDMTKKAVTGTVTITRS